MAGLMNLKAQRCRIYKLNIMDAMTDTERRLYNFYRNGMSKNKLQKATRMESPTCKEVAELFSISVEDAQTLIDEKFPKNKLKKFVKEKIEQFPEDGIREITSEFLYHAAHADNNGLEENMSRQVVWFENECVRRCGYDLSNVPLISEIMLLCCNSDTMNGILNQIIEKGVIIDGKHYIFFTSSTGQMKEREITLLEEEFWKKHQYSLMCGLTEERINKCGGINTGKYFAAKALNLSNSVLYDSGLDIDEVIIVPDMSTQVSGMVNYLDVDTLDISEKEMKIAIEHMDGAGIFLPGVFPCSCQIRGGWLKGAVFPFDFHKFIEANREKLSSLHMSDAWGNPLTIDDFLDAKMILTDSQFKMRKYYYSMEEYRECFKKSELSITINNCAHSCTDKVKVAYQPFQTIPRERMTEEAIQKLAQKSVDYINGAKHDEKIALQMLGVDMEEENPVKLSPLLACLYHYPEMLQDIHVKKTMESVLKAERNQAQGSKLILNGMWSYICPDLYAFCEWLFLGEENPEGLLPNGYVYHHYYDDTDIEKVCCLRYPHLSDCEHGIRKVLQSDECKKWFVGMDTIVSCHDLISKALQADWDGDHICNVHDKAFLDVVGNGNHPLYYEMEKAPAKEISNKNNLYCLLSSFHNENIGFVSNAITKIFSEEKPDIRLVRVLCAYNNFVIDYFKTQKKMDLKWYTEVYEQYKDRDSKVPYFFHFTKSQKLNRCKGKKASYSNADRICEYVTLETKPKREEPEPFFMKMKREFYPDKLIDKSIIVDRKSEEYELLRVRLQALKIEQKSIYKRIKQQLNEKDISSLDIFYLHCFFEIQKIIPDRKQAAMYLLDIEYCQPENTGKKKDILWNCYGAVLYQNLMCNLENPDQKVTAKRIAYTANHSKIKEIEQLREAVIEEMEEGIKVSIPAAVYDTIMTVKTRKDCVNDKYLLFIIYVLVHRNMNKYGTGNNYVKLFKNARTGTLTKATLDKWMEAQCSNSGIKRLCKKGYLRIEENRDYMKIWVNMDCPEPGVELLSATHNNPLIDLFLFNKERTIKQCEVCHKDYIAHGNTKTCGKKCSQLLNKMNKNKCA